jgi:hypothetical protein
MINVLAILIDIEKYFSCVFLLYYLIVLANVDTYVTFGLAFFFRCGMSNMLGMWYETFIAFNPILH